MTWTSRLRSLWRNLVHKQASERRLDEEVRAYAAILEDEHAARGLPRLEGGHLDLGAVLAREGGHPGVRLHAEHGAAGGLELPGGDPGADADVEHPAPGALGDDRRHQGVGIAGPAPVVALGVRAERLCDLPVLVRTGFTRRS